MMAQESQLASARLRADCHLVPASALAGLGKVQGSRMVGVLCAAGQGEMIKILGQV